MPVRHPRWARAGCAVRTAWLAHSYPRKRTAAGPLRPRRAVDRGAVRAAR